jgi:hypothetical protein
MPLTPGARVGPYEITGVLGVSSARPRVRALSTRNQGSPHVINNLQSIINNESLIKDQESTIDLQFRASGFSHVIPGNLARTHRRSLGRWDIDNPKAFLAGGPCQTIVKRHQFE